MIRDMTACIRAQCVDSHANEVRQFIDTWIVMLIVVNWKSK